MTSASDPALSTWLIVELDKDRFALPVPFVRELVRIPRITEVPGVDDSVRGVMDLRGKVIPVLDLRKRMGLPSVRELNDAFHNLMEQRRVDHIRWLEELEASVREGREFLLQTDPTQCAFGKWYYSYQPENVWVGGLLRQFEKPHERIHRTAKDVAALVAKGKPDQAMTLIERRRGDALAAMLKLFDNLQQLIVEVQRETAVVLDSGGRNLAVLVDSAVAVEVMHPESLELLPQATRNPLVTHCMKPKPGARPALVFSVDELFGHAPAMI